MQHHVGWCCTEMSVDCHSRIGTPGATSSILSTITCTAKLNSNINHILVRVFISGATITKNIASRNSSLSMNDQTSSTSAPPPAATGEGVITELQVQERVAAAVAKKEAEKEAEKKAAVAKEKEKNAKKIDILKKNAVEIAAENKQLRDLDDGSYLSLIDELWGTKMMKFREIDENMFRRSGISAQEFYTLTTAGAADKGAEVADDSSRATPKSSISSRANQLDIFGFKSRAPSAHLMPYATCCSSYWFYIISWILLCMNSKLPSAYSQKCIHGSKSKKRKRGKVSLTGIKHFPTNRIRLHGQGVYFDTYPCVMIIPIMEVNDVKNWKGEAYDAIVVAGDWNEAEIEGKTVYRLIGATRGGSSISLADTAEHDRARDVFEKMILCVCKSLTGRTTNSISMLKKKGKGKGKSVSELNCENLLRALEQLNRTGTVKVPTKKTRGTFKVRKISFSESTNANNPAPDPVLLLAKAVSNYLKRQNLIILPGCERDDDESTSVMSLTQEFAMRGWPTNIRKKLRACKEVEFDVGKKNTVDDPLTDDDNDDYK
jgi:hypothetical protein